MKNIFFKLDEKKVVPCSVSEVSQRKVIDRVDLTVTDTGYLISTVFLPIGHGFSCDDCHPIVFETMVFDLLSADIWYDKYMRTYSSWNDAQAGHSVISDRFEKMDSFKSFLRLTIFSLLRPIIVNTRLSNEQKEYLNGRP